MGALVVSFLAEATGGGAEAPLAASALRTSFAALPDRLNLAFATVCCIDLATHPLVRRGETPAGQARMEQAVERWANRPVLTIIVIMTSLRKKI